MRNAQTQESAKVKISIPEPYKGTNWELLDKYIKDYTGEDVVSVEVMQILKEIQSRLVSDMPKIGEEEILKNLYATLDLYFYPNASCKYTPSICGDVRRDMQHFIDYIKRVFAPPPPPEISSAIKLLEDSNYIVTKK